jgi:hypothetical protein
MPDAPSDCLAALIGLSRSGSPCFPLPEPAAGDTNAWLTASTSGYYLDLLEGLSFRVANGNGAPDLYFRLERARTLAALNLRAKLRLGAIGQPRFAERGALGGAGNGAVGTAGPLPLTTCEREGGALRITSIRLNTTSTVLSVAILLDGQEVARLASTNTAPQAVSLTIPLDGATHTLEAVLPSGVLPLENKLHCPPCSGATAWGKAVARNLQGVTSATSAKGFQLQLSEVCAADVSDLLCYAITGDDQATEERRQMAAQAMMYTAGALLVKDFITDARFDRYSMMEPKMLPALGASYEAEADKAAKWLNGAEGLGRVVHPCYQCAPVGWHPTITNQLR